MRGHQDRGLLFVGDAAEAIPESVAGDGVEIAGGLVGQQQLGTMHHGAGDGDALHLSAGKLMRHSGAKVAQLDKFELMLRPIARIGLARQQQGKFDIFQNS